MGRRTKRRRGPDPFDGILPVDKPAGWTSHDVVAKIRNHFRLSKVGHGGTLDPMATGLLIVLIGKGTKLSQTVMNGDKTYEGVIRLGITTDSQDRDGTILQERDPSGITRERLERLVAERFVGEFDQIPPMVSAIKKNGVALYKLARQGKEIEREPRKVRVESFEILDFENPLLQIRVRCSKGTYIRTLAHDIGRALDVGGTLDALRRTASGTLDVEQAHSLADVLERDRETLAEWVSPQLP